ncbi:MAG: polysaccharide biosynthesis protein, partial [Alphaproteobacteria bacterium]|nr:polysaccharide biosynthesis protein [Alphaproteobacteria bacterium]
MFNLEKKIIVWLFGLNHSKKRLIQIVFDSLLSAAMLLVAFLMRLEKIDFVYNLDTYIGLLVAVPASVLVFAAQGQYNIVTRHISIEVAYKIIIGSAVSCAVLLSTILLFELQIPRSVPLIYGTLLCLFATIIRFFIRALGQNLNKKGRENVAIYGTVADSVQLIEALRKNSNYRIKMLIDDSPEMLGKKIFGIKIFDLNEAIKKISKLEIKTLLIAVPSDFQAIRGRVLEVLSDKPLRIKTIPNISSLISGEIKISELRDIKIEDLLGRKPAEHSSELMAKTITGKTVFVTGAGGSIGSELCRQIIRWKPEKLILLDISEYAIYNLLSELGGQSSSNDIEFIPLLGSVQDRLFIKKIFDRFAIDTTYHAAAYKHVPLMERNVMQCFSNNVFGTLNMAELAIAANVKNFVLISTDK